MYLKGVPIGRTGFAVVAAPGFLVQVSPGQFDAPRPRVPRPLRDEVKLPILCPCCDGQGFHAVTVDEEFIDAENGQIVEEDVLGCGHCDETGRVLVSRDEWEAVYKPRLARWRQLGAMK